MRNITRLGYNNVAVVSRKQMLPEEFIGCAHFSDLDKAFNNQKYDVAFICTPTATHVEQLIFLMQKRVKSIYVEKPLGNSLEHVAVIRQLAESYENKIVLGYDLHFDPGMQRVKSLLNTGMIGKVIAVNAFVGQHLSQWRPYEDHRKGMSAKNETGGGVLLDLIHELEYLYRLFGDVSTVACNLTNTGVLEIETEESADVLLKFTNGISGTVHLDYWQKKLIRNAIITGTEGTIYWNLAERFVQVINKANEEDVFSYKDFERNERFVAIIKSFLEGRNEHVSSLDDGIKSLRIVLAAKKAAQNNCVIKIADIG